MHHNQNIRCPECGSPTVFATRPDTVEYKGQKATVKVAAHWCTACPEAVLDGPALAAREQAFLDLRARVEGLLAPSQVARIRKQLGLSQRKAGEILGGGKRGFQKYEAGKQQLSTPMNQLLRLLANDPTRLRELEVIAAAPATAPSAQAATARDAVRRIRREAVETGAYRLTDADVRAEVAAVRKQRPRRRRSA
jgi:HTH-type transcriptional regulator / antitoxin MqsA